jgi:hypothetical protein
MRPRSYTVPLVVLGVVLFGLLTAIAVVVGVRLGAGDARPCVVGDWRVVSYEETIDLGELGAVPITGGEAARLRLSADGAGSTDYGSATVFTGTSRGHAVRVELSGRVDFRYSASEQGALIVSDVRSAPLARVLVDDRQVGDPVAMRPETGAMSYSCSGDELIQRGDQLVVVYTRV